MRKGFALAAAAAVLCVVGVGSARAIVGGTLDNGAHPYVVLLKITHADGSIVRCSGVLVNGTKVITAAHCVAGEIASIGVFTADGPITTQKPNAVASSYVIEPGYIGLDTKNADTHDLAVITLAKSIKTSVRPTIAPVGYADAFAKKSAFTVVGYGIQSVHPEQLDRTRYEATSDLKNAPNAFNLRLTNNSGGACFGDSGGPVLDGDVVVAILSTTQNNNCTSSSYAYRLDTAESRDFLAANGAL
jgi:secreted trypsin-like serine protease